MAQTPSSSKRIRVGVVGVGRMGQHHARAYSRMDDVELVGVVDADRDRARAISSELSVQAFDTSAQLIGQGVQAVTIAVPTVKHLDVARDFLEAGIACLIEKPLAPNVGEARSLAEIAQSTGATLQVGHIERFNPAVRALSDHEELTPRFIEVHRVSPMSFRSVDVGVVFDMMIHDLDVILMLARCDPEQVQATSVAVMGAAEDVCNARLEFPSGCVANVTASRLALKTERKIRIVADDAYVSIDFARKNGIMIRRTANAEQLDSLRADLAAGRDLSDLDYTKLVNIEPLAVDDADQLAMQLREFVNAVRSGSRPIVDVHAGFAAVDLAQRIVASAQDHARRLSAPTPVQPTADV